MSDDKETITLVLTADQVATLIGKLWELAEAKTAENTPPETVFDVFRDQLADLGLVLSVWPYPAD